MGDGTCPSLFPFVFSILAFFCGGGVLGGGGVFLELELVVVVIVIVDVGGTVDDVGVDVSVVFSTTIVGCGLLLLSTLLPLDPLLEPLFVRLFFGGVGCLVPAFLRAAAASSGLVGIIGEELNTFIFVPVAMGVAVEMVVEAVVLVLEDVEVAAQVEELEGEDKAVVAT